ncbi:MAG: type I glyceraldehyde-3-phosphate dehydrogenase [Chloroflexi bacterium]|nr:type I glyceraldehyde-3-phosphate dehydrogenase [Chloroflexota bacterium]
MTRIALNGFGRIGRQVFKILWQEYPQVEVVAIGVTEPGRAATRAILLKYDSVYGQFTPEVEARVEGKKNALVVNGREIPIMARTERYGPTRWSAYGADIVIDATGYCRSAPRAEHHLKQGARKVIVTMPMEGEDITIIMGVNHAAYDPARHHIISASSCTTNCLAPVAHVLQERVGMIEGMMTTVHAVTNSQSLLDKAQADPRLSRSAYLNIVPASTGATEEAGHIVPALKNRFLGSALRVPVPTVSLLDLTAHLAEPLTIEEVNQAFRDAAANSMRGILAVTDDELVSSDFIGDRHSAIVDARSTMTAGPLVKVNAWYDNEWGYAHRVADLAALVAAQMEPMGAKTMRVAQPA